MESYEALQLGQMYFLAVGLSEIVSATIVCVSLPSFLSPFLLKPPFFCLTRPCLSPLEFISLKHRNLINPGNLHRIGETVLGLAIMCVFGLARAPPDCRRAAISSQITNSGAEIKNQNLDSKARELNHVPTPGLVNSNT
jgi:hypothetical protein